MVYYVPVDLRCRFCKMTFCCKDCREKHENFEHHRELDLIARENYLESICYLCHGMPLPYHPRQKLPDDLMAHIVRTHFPLKCDKCAKVFETLSDVEQIGKCCSQKLPPPPPLIPIKESFGKGLCKQETSRKRHAEEVKLDYDCDDDEALTPLTKINLKWRRKSKEFTLKLSEEQEVVKNNIVRSTSTPMPLESASQESLNSLQYSSIHYNSSTDTDFSPPLTSQKMPPPVPTPPKSVKKTLSQNRQKIHPQNTPLRQALMTKSIQRAIATHGPYRNFKLQQRKMSFNSSTSSNEKSASLMKFNETDGECGERPLDLRTSPALQRELAGQELAIASASDAGAKEMQSIPEEASGGGSSSSTSGEAKVDFQYEEIQVIYKTENSSIVTNYRSCFSESATPRVGSSNMLKKTISFESPAILEQTPACLMPRRAYKQNYSQTDDDNEDDDDNNCKDDTVFYTPKSTPAQRPALVRRMSTPEVRSQIRDKAPEPKTGIFWKYMSSAFGNIVGGGKASKSVDDLTKTPPSSGSEVKWIDVLPNPLKAAAEYFVKGGGQMDVESRAQKRRHPSNDEVKLGHAIKSPTYKKRRIQGRKPIRRLQSDA